MATLDLTKINAEPIEKTPADSSMDLDNPSIELAAAETSSNHPREVTTFSSLPLELRDMIYELAIPRGEVHLSARVQEARPMHSYPGMLLINRQFHTEASPLYYKYNSFRLRNYTIAADFLSNLSLEQMKALRDVRVLNAYGSREQQRKEINTLIKEFGQGVLKPSAVWMINETRNDFVCVLQLEDLVVSEDGKENWSLLWKRREKRFMSFSGPTEEEDQEAYERRAEKSWRKIWGWAY